MSPTIGIVERMRWMSALVASAVLTVGVIIALSVVGKPLTAPVAAPAPDAAGSSATLDPRIGTLAARHPSRVVEAIVQFKAGVTAAAQRADVARVGGRVTGNLHIINGVAAKLTASDAGRLAASGDVHAVSLNSRDRSAGRSRRGRPGHHLQPDARQPRPVAHPRRRSPAGASAWP